MKNMVKITLPLRDGDNNLCSYWQNLWNFIRPNYEPINNCYAARDEIIKDAGATLLIQKNMIISGLEFENEELAMIFKLKWS